MEIVLLLGDITEVHADAIVNAANNQLWMGAGVAGAIKRKGGKIIEEEALQKGPIQHGDAVETTAGKLNAKYVIHAATMRSDGFITAESLRSSVLKSLQLAEKLALSSIAFPALGTGVAGFPVRECAKIMIETITSFSALTLQKVYLVLYNKQIYIAFQEELYKKKN
ncbi:MAG: macro domain-containing protein [Candidatus Heimdallarchaeota archaeon]